MVRRDAVISTLIYAAVSLAAALLCLLFTVLALRADEKRAAEAVLLGDAASVYPLVVVDAGHGGEDGGASDAKGRREADINLAVAEMLRDYLRLCGIPVLMTREDDRLLYDAFGDLSDYTGYKKTYDLRNRLRIAETNPNAVFVSVHMNTFPQGQYSGLQTWYSPNNPGSRELALAVQTHAATYADKNNTRQIKKAGTGIYLLSRIQLPAVLVECGFLSNAEEAELLSTEEYRRLLAVVIGTAVMKFLDGYENQA